MRRVLVLRPEPGASLTVERARKLGLDAIAIPLFEVDPLAWTAPDAGSFDGLLLTSANAVRHAGGQLAALRGLPVYAVGEATADAAREAGFDIRSIGDSNVDRLLGSIEADLRLLHLCGSDRKAPDQPRQRIEAVPVYHAKELADVGLGDTVGAIAVIHSPRAGRRFAELAGGRSTIAVAAISPAAAEAVGDGWADLRTAERPDDTALLALAARLCNKLDGE